MSDTLAFRDAVWLVDSSPGSNVSSRDVIGWASVATRNTDEMISCFSIGFFAMVATRACRACVSRVYQDHRYTGYFSLVVDEGA